jgi:cytochrome P450
MPIKIPSVTTSEVFDNYSGDLYEWYSKFFSRSPLRINRVQSEREQSAIFFSRYDQVKFFLSQHEFTSKEVTGKNNLLEAGSTFSESLLFKDGLEHQNLKNIFAQYFRRVSVSSYHQVVVSKARECFDKVDLGFRTDDFELMSGFCKKLPLVVVMKLIGLPEDSNEEIVSLFQEISNGLDHVTSSTEVENNKNTSFTKFLDVLEDGLFEKWKYPSQSLLANVRYLVDTEKLSKRCATENIALLLFAGLETTAALIGSMIYCLAVFPQQLSLLRQNRELISSTIEEVLRFESPLQRATFRCVSKDFTQGGFDFAKNEEIILLLGAANRDDKIFREPNKFIISRTPNPHLSFGKGIYHCLGRQLAVIEAQAVCDFLLDRYPGFWQVDKAEWENSTLLRSLKTLSINFAGR